MKMKAPFRHFPRSLLLLLAFGMIPLAYSQISEAKLDKIFSRLNGEDFDARYAARIELQDEVVQATAPGNETQQPKVEAQILERLATESRLTTKLWLLRQLEIIGSPAAIPALTELTSSDEKVLADGARMAIERIEPINRAMPEFELKATIPELAELVRSSPNRSIRSMAFSRLSAKKPRLAAKLMLEAEGPSAADYLRIAMTSGKSGLQKKALAMLPNSTVDKQIAIIGALPSGPSSQFETVLLGLLSSDNETLEMQTIEAIGRVGSFRSLDPLLERIESRTRDLRDAAADSLADIEDPRIDKKLNASLSSGDLAERIIALKALSLRANSGIGTQLNAIASDRGEEAELRAEAIDAMELVGDVDSIAVLVDIITSDEAPKLTRNAQRIVKRLTLRLADPDAAWLAFKSGFEKSEGNAERRLDLMLVSDSAPSKDTLSYLESAWDSGDDSIQKMVLKVLPNWRNWDGGFTLLEISDRPDLDPLKRQHCFDGVGKLILGSDANYPIQVKFELAGAALDKAKNSAEREAVIKGFRYSTWRERVHVTYNNVDKELTEAVLRYAEN